VAVVLVEVVSAVAALGVVASVVVLLGADHSGAALVSKALVSKALVSKALVKVALVNKEPADSVELKGAEPLEGELSPAPSEALELPGKTCLAISIRNRSLRVALVVPVYSVSARQATPLVAADSVEVG
jgi:hypothetical protein